MKIACIASAQIPSTTANSIQVMKVCQALARLEHEVVLLAPMVNLADGEAGWEDLARHYGLGTPFEIIHLPLGLGRFGRRIFPWRAAWAALRLNPDLLYVWPVQSAVAGLLARRPVIYELHDLPTGRVGPIWYRLFARLPGRKRLVAITRALLNAVQKEYRTAWPESQVVIGPNGVDLERFEGLGEPAAARRALGLPDRLTVVCTGHLYAGRGAGLFLALAEAIPQAQFLWVGGRPEDVTLWKTKAEEVGLTNVTFTGFVPNRDLPHYQAAAEVLLMPYGRQIAGSSGGDSAAIASPMKMFDYMAAGRAIVSADLPVIREVLSEEQAVFCPPEDTAAWTAAVSALVVDEGRRKVLGRRARADIQKYTWLERARRTLANFL